MSITMLAYINSVSQLYNAILSIFYQIVNSMGTILGISSQCEIDMEGPKAEFVKAEINGNKVVIFSKSYCPYCVMAKEQFKKLNQSFACIELDEREDANEIQSILGEITGERTVPRVFIDGKCIGGGTDVKKMYENGSLKKLLA